MLSGKGLLQRHVLTHYHNLHDFLSGVWHIQELLALSEPGTRSRLWSKHQTRSLPVWFGGGHSSGIGFSFTNALKTVESCTRLPLDSETSAAESLLIFLQQISVMSPGDIVKVRLQCQTESKRAGTNMPKPKYHGPIHCLLSIIKEERIMGLYRGALPLMLRDGPSYAIYFLTYATICEYLTDSGKKRPSE